MIQLVHSTEELGEAIFKKTQESPDEKLQRITGEIEQKKKVLGTTYSALISHFSTPAFKTKMADFEVAKDILGELKDYLGSEIQNAAEKELDHINGLLVNGLLINSRDAENKIKEIRKLAENVIQELMLMRFEGYPDSEGSYDHNPEDIGRTMPDYFGEKGIPILKNTNNGKTPHKIQDLYNLVELVSLMILQVEILADKSAQKNTSVKLRRRTSAVVSNIQA